MNQMVKRYIVEYQEPAGCGYWYELASFRNRDEAIDFIVNRMNNTHSYRLVKEIRIEEYFTELNSESNKKVK